MLLTEFETTFAAIEGPQTYAFDNAATGIGYIGNIRGVFNRPSSEHKRLKQPKNVETSDYDLNDLESDLH